MEQSTFTVRVLEPEEGLYLTQSNLEEGVERTFSTKVFLAQDASPNQWRSATPEEKEEYDKNQENQ